MNESHKASPQCRKPTRWVLLLSFFGVVVAVVFGRPLLESFQKKPKATPPEIRLPEPQTKVPPKPEDVAKPHLSNAEEAAERAIEEHVKFLDTFFADAKKGTRPFAEEALSWSSKGRLARIIRDRAAGRWVV
jgi:hypothetical protein